MIVRPASMIALLLALSAGSRDPLAGRVAGEPVECIRNGDATGRLEVLDSKTLAYSRTSKRLWITHPEGYCSGFRPFQTLIIQQTGSQLCRGDRFNTLRAPSSIPSATCAFGVFTPYDKVTHD